MKHSFFYTAKKEFQASKKNPCFWEISLIFYVKKKTNLVKHVSH